jgi:lipopolysaccharide biosynthesis glycosyltransferase
MTLTPPGRALQVVTAADEHYLPYLACHLLSLGERGSAAVPFEVTVIHRGIPSAARNALAAMVPHPHRLRWVEPTAALLREVGAPSEFEACTPHYFRLLMPFLLPEHALAIYIDADTIILDDITPLWDTELEDYAVGAVRDYLPCIHDAVSNWHELGLNPEAPYFNSGVLVADLQRWREERIPQRVLAVCRENHEHLRAQNRWPQYDQYGLNVVIHGRWKQLPRSWNHGTDLAPSPARITHYIGNGKAGRATCQPLFNQLFFDTLKRTPWRGTMPPGGEPT